MKAENFEKENQTGKNTDGPHANFPVRILTSSSIVGDHVENKQGEHIGKIKDIMLNIKEGKIEYVVIEYGGFIGIGEKLFAVPFQALKLNQKNATFILDVEKEFMKNAPGFDKNHWPETNGHYFDQANQHWGDFMGPSVG